MQINFSLKSHFLRRSSAAINFAKVLVVGFTCLLFQCSSKNESVEVNLSKLIPRPVTMAFGNGYFTIDEKTQLATRAQEVSGVAQYLADIISEASSFNIETKILEDKELGSENLKNVIVLVLENGDASERYSLKITHDQIRISAPSLAGLFYGVQSLRQLLPPGIEMKNKNAGSWVVPVVSIEDAPKFSWRGMHIDVSRHFFSVAFMKKFIDRLALYKLNKLHIHLTDDQGWRIEIKKFPQLVEQGAWRVLNNQDSACIARSKVNSDFILPTEFFIEKNGVSMYGGYYTQEDIKEIIRYASKRFITVVPEIDMPGHSDAAIKSFPGLTCLDGRGWGKLFTIPLCPCEETTYTFITDVLTEIAPLFPGEYIHIGADEVDGSTWLKAASCKKLLHDKEWKSQRELHSYFVNRVNKIVTGLGKKTIGWDEIIDGNVDTSITVMYWRGWVADAPARAAHSNHNVVMSPTSHCYFDYEPNDKTLESMYLFNPVSTGIAPCDTNRILGLQGNIWTEAIPTPARLDYMTMPRMTALAEVGWAGTGHNDWVDFSAAVTQHYARWDVMDIKYRVPDIPSLKKQVVFIDTTTLDLKIPLGISEIRYTRDGTEPTVNSTLYSHPLRIDSSLTVKILTLGFKGRAGNRYTIHFEKQDFQKPLANNTVLKNGLSCKYFEASYNSVEKISRKDLKKETIVDSISIPSFCRESIFALQFTGMIDIPTEGIYTFYLSSDDGSTLKIGNTLVVNNDGFHGSGEVDGQVALAKGLHTIVLKYFDGGGANGLSLMYEGPGITKQAVPRGSFKIR